jgi:parvulin-like peptidyl-prolyl isomerase
MNKEVTMKAKKMTALALSCTLLLTGCSAGKTSNGKSVAASTSIGNIYADDLYKSLSSGANSDSSLFSYVLDQLIDEKFPATNDMKESANEMYKNVLSSYKQQYSSEKEAISALRSDLKSSGQYTGISDYKKKLVYSIQYSQMIKKYVKAHFNSVYNDYYKMATPRKISIISISSSNPSSPTKSEKAKLKEVQALLKEGQSFASVASKYSDDTDTKSADGSLGVIDTTNSLDSTYASGVSEKALALKSGQTSSVIKGTSAFYILHCDTTSKSEIKKALKNVTIDSPLLTYDNYIVYLVFKTYNIKYGDANIKKKINAYVKEQLAARAKERKDK